MFVERYAFCAKEKSVYKIYTTEVVFSLNNLLYNSVVSLVFMALREKGYPQYLLKDRSECLTIDSYFCSKKYLGHRRIMIFIFEQWTRKQKPAELN